MSTAPEITGDVAPGPSLTRVRAAWILALVADAMQIILMPALGEGFLSPAMDAVDLVVGIGMVVLLGWHFAFLPTALAEVIPALNVFPTWTAAVFFVTRKHKKSIPPKQLPPATR